MDSNEAETKSKSNEVALRNIYETAFLLRQRLVPDVVPLILHYAGLFERHTYSTVRTRPLNITQSSAPNTCLTTFPIRSSAKLQYPVRKVVFAIQSCDQGCKKIHGCSQHRRHSLICCKHRGRRPECRKLDVVHGRYYTKAQ